MDALLQPAAVGGDNNVTHGVLSLNYLDFELILRNSYAGTPVIPIDYPIGRRYYTAVLLGSRESTVGTRVAEVSLVFECNEIFFYDTRAFRLFSEVPSDVLNGLPNVE